MVRHNSMFARLLGGGAHFGVFAQLQLVARLDVALGRVEQVDAKDRVVRSQAQPVNALLEVSPKTSSLAFGSSVSDFVAPSGQGDLRAGRRLQRAPGGTGRRL